MESRLQRSFSLVADDEIPSELNDAEIEMIKKHSASQPQRKNLQEMDDDDDDDYENNSPKVPRQLSHENFEPNLSNKNQFIEKIPSAGPSGRQTVLRRSAPNKNRFSNSESDLDDSDDGDKSKVIPGEYDPKNYEHLDVNAEIKEIFQYITKYIPQPMSLDFRFKPFVPEFLPAVGDIDAFLKVIPPNSLLTGEKFEDDANLGLVVLDEPAANQSDAALLHLQLRAESVNTSHSHDDVVVKKVENVEKSAKTIDKWIKDISALHKSKSSPSVKYSQDMPDLDELMQEWPEDVEKKLKDNFPKPRGESLNDYIDEVCGVFQIPSRNKIESLHLLFSLYAAVKSSQLFKTSQEEKIDDGNSSVTTADQLVLE